MSSAADVRRVMIECLGHGALLYDDLVATVSAKESLGSAATTRRQVESILHGDSSFARPGERVCYSPALSDGVSWTVKVDAAEAAQGFVRAHPALDAISWWLVECGADLVNDAGTVIGRVETDGLWLDGVDTDVVTGPPGWLDHVAGGWALVTVSNETLRTSRLEEPPMPTPRQAAATRAGFTAAAKSSEAVLFDGETTELRYVVGDGLLHEALLADREAFVNDPVAFLPDLYVEAGLEERGRIIAEIGFDWDALSERQNRNRMAAFYGLDEARIDELIMVAGACDVFATDGEDALGPADENREGAAILLSALLEDGDVAEAFWAEAVRRGRTTDEVAAFADELHEWMTPVDLAGLAWVRSRCLEERDAMQAAMELIESVVGPGCTHRPALLDAAGYAADRGDAPTALRLVLQTDPAVTDPDDDNPDDANRLLREVLAFASNRPKATAGRNDRCPCGSGRKYKACHDGKERHALTDRASWLFEKASRFVHRHDADLLDELVEDLCEYAPSLYRQFTSSPFVLDLALHEHGLFDEFLEERGWLLPDDEQLLAAQWSLIDRGVFELVEVRGERLELRNIGNGESVTVVNATLSGESGPGTTMIGRPLPVGETHRAFGGFIPIPRSLVNPMIDALSEGDPDEIVGLLASMFAPPSLRNTSGETLSFHTLRWNIDDPAAMPAALTRTGFNGDGGETWSLTSDTPGMRAAIIATLRIDPESGELVGDVNSDERATLLQERIGAALPTATLASDANRTFADVHSEQSDAPHVSSIDQNDPEIQRFVDEFMVTKETEWLDEHIPALGGRTPREAVKDPVGREEVRQLLDAWPEPPPGTPGTGFRASRIRALLGLND